VSAIGKLNEFPPDSYHAQEVVPGLVGVGGIFSAKFTCVGPQVRVSGPGVAIVSSVPGGGYAAWDGTSMATPHITGMGALLLAHHPIFRGMPRSAQRVAQLFQLLGASASPYLGDPTREGAGLPDLQQVPGLAAVPPQPSMAPQTLFGPQAFGFGGPLGGLGGVATSPGAFAAMPNGAPFGLFVNPAAMQALMQLRAAGLV
jgi:subtilisin